MILEYGADGSAQALRKAETTIKYHIERLRVRGIIEDKRICRYIFYSLRDSTILDRLMGALLIS